MKKLSLLLIIAMLFATMIPASAEGDYSQSPTLDAKVEAGELPPLEERLPEEPLLVQEVLAEYLDYEVGVYGGSYSTLTTSPNWNAEVFIGNNEALLCMRSTNSDEIVGNVLLGYDVNEDNTVYTLYLRKGLKWSDGTPVTMDDFMFTYNHVILNEELTPVISANMRSGAKADGAVMQYEAIDDWTLQITFEESYGGFPVYISIKGWAGYTDMLKPAHYLKQFHPDYAEEIHGSMEAYYEFIAPFAKVLGYDDPTEEGVWVFVFNQVDMTNWELSDPNDALTSEFFEGLVDFNFPVLYPWVMESAGNNSPTYVRNPYYFKVDAEGQQLPYADYLVSRYIEDEQTMSVEIIAGNVDFSGTVNGEFTTLYLEHEKEGGYKVVSAMDPETMGVATININYGLNADGTVKDDPDSQAWQEMISDIRFRQALMYAVDAEDMNDVVYSGRAEVNPVFSCNADYDKANELLDEMGAVDIDGDGYRETPSGLPFTFQLWARTGNDHITFAEMYCEYWREIGINCSVYATEESLLTTSVSSNEVPVRVHFIGGASNWPAMSWGIGTWAPLYSAWINAGGLSGEPVEGYLEPPQEIKDFVILTNSTMEVTPDVAANEVTPALHQYMADNLYNIIPLVNHPSAIVYSNRIGNIPNGGACWTHNMNFDMERLFIREE